MFVCSLSVVEYRDGQPASDIRKTHTRKGRFTTTGRYLHLDRRSPAGAYPDLQALRPLNGGRVPGLVVDLRYQGSSPARQPPQPSGSPPHMHDLPDGPGVPEGGTGGRPVTASHRCARVVPLALLAITIT